MRRIISIVLLLSLMLISVIGLTSCDIIESVLGSTSNQEGDEETSVLELSGRYVRVVGNPAPEVTFEGENVLVKMGRRNMSGTYAVRKTADDTYEIVFDFGNSTTPIGGIGSGVYPLSVGTHKGIEYLMLFGSRFDKQ